LNLVTKKFKILLFELNENVHDLNRFLKNKSKTKTMASLFLLQTRERALNGKAKLKIKI
jgi:hypothetical protein